VPEQTVCVVGEAKAVLDGGFTTTVAVTGVPTQPFLVGVTVNRTLSAVPVVFVS
jgi:hypothetical protein